MSTDNTRHARQPRRWAAFLAVLLIAGPAAAETASGPDTPNDVAATPSRYELFPGFTLGGSLRVRTEDAQNFRFGTNPLGGSDDESFDLTQLRVNLMWEWSENLTFYFEGQDSRIHRENLLINDRVIPNQFEDHFDLYQGYMDWKTSLAGAPTRFRIGRQEFDFGDQRLIGSDSWTNVARVFDAVRMTWGTEGERTWDFFSSAAVPVRPGNFNDHDATLAVMPLLPPVAEVIPTAAQYADSEFHGIYLRDWKWFPNAEWDAYLLYRREDTQNDKVYTLGTRYDWKQGVWDWNAEVAYQWGDFMALDHEAWMLHVGLGYTAESFYNSRFGVAISWATGDDNGLDGDHETFDNLFPTNHWQYGQMDFVSLQNTRNLELSWDTSFDKAKLRFALHAFFLNEEDSDFWYGANLAPIRLPAPVPPPFIPVGFSADDHIGNEFDITIRYPLMDGKVDLVAGYSHFWTEGYVSDTGTSRDAHYGFLQATYQF